MSLRDWFRPPRHVLTMFLGVAAVSAATLGWFAWQLLAQDQAVETQRRQDHLEQAADRAIATFGRALADLESRLSRAADPPAGVTRISAEGSHIAAQPTGLLYYPVADAGPEAPPDTFAEPERLEFSAGSLTASIPLYSHIADSANPAVSAGALTRLARVYRKLHDLGSAERAYNLLAAIPRAAVVSLPASLIAAEGLCTLYEEAHDAGGLRRQAASFQYDLLGSRWQLLRSQFDFYLSETTAWLGSTAPIVPDAIARADALSWLWQNSSEPSSSRLLLLSGVPALAVWRQTAGRLEAAIAGPQYLDALAREAVADSALRVSLTDTTGAVILGQTPPTRGAAVRTASATRPPWSLHIYSGPGAPMETPRRQLLLGAFVVLALILTAGAAFILHAISRELRVARLQSDFVAAVSHEFRSPLSSLSQISEMLVRDRFPSDDLRRKSYDVLMRETARLRGLVEGLLDFGRFESGAGYRFEALEAGSLIRTLVADFQERIAADGYSIELDLPAGELPIRADREALTRAIWNLLDNAVKYSPECRTVWVDVAHEADRISIAVRDRGLGIPASEQPHIFDKFVRGAESKNRRIKGTGIGLAMVRNIARAHGGEIRLSSEPGQGSRFTLLLRTSGGVS